MDGAFSPGVRICTGKSVPQRAVGWFHVVAAAPAGAEWYPYPSSFLALAIWGPSVLFGVPSHVHSVARNGRGHLGSTGPLPTRLNGTWAILAGGTMLTKNRSR